MINGKVKLLSQDGQVLFSEIEAHLLDLVKTKLLKPYNNILQTEFDNFTNNDLLDATNEIKDLVEEEINKVKDLIVNPDLSNLANKEELKNLYNLLENLQVQIQNIPTQATIELPVNSKVAQKEIIDRFKKLEEELRTVISRSVTGKNVIMRGGGRTLIKVKNEGTEIASAMSSINFTGSSVTATNDNGNVTIDIIGGGISAGENIAIDNSDPANLIISSSGQSDPNLTILGTGVAGDEFRYNEVVVIVSASTVALTDADIYKTFTTDGSNDFILDFTAVTLSDFTIKVLVNTKQQSRIEIPVVGEMWIGNYQYFNSIFSADKGAAATIRLYSGWINITNLTGNWTGS